MGATGKRSPETIEAVRQVRHGEVTTLESAMKSKRLKLSTLLDHKKFKVMKPENREILLRMRLVDWLELQTFLNDCVETDIEMLRELVNVSVLTKRAGYVTTRIHARFTKLRNLVERHILHVQESTI